VSNRWIITLKVLVHAACLAPVAWLVWGLFQNTLGPDPTAHVTFFTGLGTLRILILSLAITPVRKLLPKLAWLIRFRRMLGLYAFFYGSLHLLTYVGLYSGFSWPTILDDLQKRPYIWAGFTSWTLLVPLALTSTTWSIRKLGGKRWQLLHRLAYVSAIAGVLHYWWLVKAGVRTPLTLTVVLAVLLAARPVLTWLDAQRKARVLTARAAAR
jgi:sulfoxide reductase heme-binding subunit YedZ